MPPRLKRAPWQEDPDAAVTMLRVHLEQNEIHWQAGEGRLEHGWVAEEDAAGSITCIDLSRCLRQPVGQVRATPRPPNGTNDGARPAAR